MGAGESESGSLNIVLWLVPVALALYVWLLPSAPGSSEVTVHQVMCNKSKSSNCDPRSSLFLVATYRADAPSNSVTYWFANDPPMVMRNCAIRDKWNWRCNADSAAEVAMADGILNKPSIFQWQTISKLKWLLAKHGEFDVLPQGATARLDAELGK